MFDLDHVPGEECVSVEGGPGEEAILQLLRLVVHHLEKQSGTCEGTRRAHCYNLRCSS